MTDNIADRIREELDKAKQLDDEARQHRQRAGELLRDCGDWGERNAAAPAWTRAWFNC